jgi:DNA-directed RNA polymerase specialized sigma24 family protein
MTATQPAVIVSPGRHVEDADAEDAVQDAFDAVWRKPSGYRREHGTVAAWLLTAVRYRAIDLARRDRTHASHHTSADLIELHPDVGDVSRRRHGP